MENFFKFRHSLSFELEVESQQAKAMSGEGIRAGQAEGCDDQRLRLALASSINVYVISGDIK